jgi:transposase
MFNARSSVPFWEDHVVDSVREEPDGSTLVTLAECPQSEALCGACRQPCSQIHERRRRRVRDRDCLDRRVWLDVPIRRLDCHHCDARVAEHIVWLDRRSRITHRVRLWVEALAQLLPIAHVAKLTGLHWHTIKTIDQQRLKRLHGEFSAQDVRRIVMDEFALPKGHRYAIVVLDAQRTRVLWVGEGNSREAIRPFFEALGVDGC